MLKVAICQSMIYKKDKQQQLLTFLIQKIQEELKECTPEEATAIAKHILKQVTEEARRGA